MAKQIEDYINENLTDEAKAVALEYVAFLRNSNIELYKDNGSCWKDKIYYWLKFKDKSVAFIVIKDPDNLKRSDLPFLKKMVELCKSHISNNDIIMHYDLLIDENNDPVHDPKPLRDYMDKWDGQAFIDKMELDKKASVLEVGVGTGRLAVRVAPLCGRLHGIDISPKTVDRAKENLSKQTNVSLYCGDFLSYEFSEVFDLIYSSLTFMHIEKKQKAINKVAALLKDNGKFVLAIDKNQDRFIDTGTRKMVSVIVAMTAGKQNHQLIDRLLPAILLDKMVDLVSAKLIFMRLSIIKYTLFMNGTMEDSDETHVFRSIAGLLCPSCCFGGIYCRFSNGSAVDAAGKEDVFAGTGCCGSDAFVHVGGPLC